VVTSNQDGAPASLGLWVCIQSPSALGSLQKGPRLRTVQWDNPSGVGALV
jgi:hypothetical protein